MPCVDAVPSSGDWTPAHFVQVFNLPAAWRESVVAATAGLTDIFGLRPGFVELFASIEGNHPYGLIRFSTIQQTHDCLSYYVGARMTVLYESPFGPPPFQMYGLDCARVMSYPNN